jgi:hypothetical protein
MQEIATLAFTDPERGKEAAVIVRASPQAVSLCLTLSSDGDVEVSFPLHRVSALIDALHSATAVSRTAAAARQAPFAPSQDGWREADHLLSANVVSRIQAALQDSPLILEHRFYRGARSPERSVFESWAQLLQYLQEAATPGDAFSLWSFDAACPEHATLLSAKYPDSDGRVPQFGAY